MIFVATEVLLDVGAVAPQEVVGQEPRTARVSGAEVFQVAGSVKVSALGAVVLGVVLKATSAEGDALCRIGKGRHPLVLGAYRGFLEENETHAFL